MKVKELMKKLSQCDENEEVFFAYPANDYWGSVLVCSVGNADRQEIATDKFAKGFVKEKKLCTSEKRYDDKVYEEVFVLTS